MSKPAGAMELQCGFAQVAHAWQFPTRLAIYANARQICYRVCRACVLLKNEGACAYQAFISTSSFMSSSLRSRSKKRYSSIASDWSGMILKRNEYLAFHFHFKDINPPLSI